MTWQLQEAKARFSELIDATLKEGPQIVTRRGVETAVVLPMDEWRRLRESARPSLKEILLAPEPRFEDLDKMIPKRGRMRGRRIDLE